jgi:hypothetical protein
VGKADAEHIDNTIVPFHRLRENSALYLYGRAHGLSEGMFQWPKKGEGHFYMLPQVNWRMGSKAVLDGLAPRAMKRKGLEEASKGGGSM